MQQLCPDCARRRTDTCLSVRVSAGRRAVCRHVKKARWPRETGRARWSNFLCRWASLTPLTTFAASLFSCKSLFSLSWRDAHAALPPSPPQNFAGVSNGRRRGRALGSRNYLTLPVLFASRRRRRSNIAPIDDAHDSVPMNRRQAVWRVGHPMDGWVDALTLAQILAEREAQNSRRFSPKIMGRSEERDQETAFASCGGYRSCP